MRPRKSLLLGMLALFAMCPISGCQAEPYPKPEPVIANTSPLDESRLYEFKRSCDSQLSAFDERLDLVDTRVDTLETKVTQLELKALATMPPPIDPKKLDPEAYEVPKIKPNSPVAKGETYETQVLGWLKSSDASPTTTVSNCPNGQCPTSTCPSGNCPSSNCPDGNCPLQTVAEVGPDDRPGHWTYPGSIDSHLKATHGVDPSGLTREQKLTLHDSLHESGKSKSAPVYSTPSPVYQTATRSTCPRGGCPPAQQSYTIRRGLFRR